MRVCVMFASLCYLWCARGACVDTCECVCMPHMCVCVCVCVHFVHVHVCATLNCTRVYIVSVRALIKCSLIQCMYANTGAACE